MNIKLLTTVIAFSLTSSSSLVLASDGYRFDAEQDGILQRASGLSSNITTNSSEEEAKKSEAISDYFTRLRATDSYKEANPSYKKASPSYQQTPTIERKVEEDDSFLSGSFLSRAFNPSEFRISKHYAKRAYDAQQLEAAEKRALVLKRSYN